MYVLRYAGSPRTESTSGSEKVSGRVKTVVVPFFLTWLGDFLVQWFTVSSDQLLLLYYKQESRGSYATS